MKEKSQPKRGAPRGNKNAFKHGFYSRHLTREEGHDLSSSSEGMFHIEVDLCRVVISRVMQSLKPVEGKPAPSFHENLSALYAVSMAVARLNRFYRTNEKRYAGDGQGWVELLAKVGLTEEQINLDVNSAWKKPSGGQIGNTNALKHGYYASAFRPEEVCRLDKVGRSELRSEIALLRVLINRTMESMEGLELAHSEYLKYLRVVTFAASYVQKMDRTERFLFAGQEAEDSCMVAVHDAGEEQGVL